MLELGAFVGPLRAPKIEPGDDGEPSANTRGVQFQASDGVGRSCADLGGCTWGPTQEGATAYAIQAFAGRAFRHWLDGGARLLVGINDDGGPLLALGPSIVFRVTSWFGAGVWALAGATTFDRWAGLEGLTLKVTPLAMAGPRGTVFALPFGVAYRFD